MPAATSMARYVSGLIDGLASEQIETTAFVADRVGRGHCSMRIQRSRSKSWVPVHWRGTSTNTRGTWRPGCSFLRRRSTRCHASSPNPVFRSPGSCSTSSRSGTRSSTRTTPPCAAGSGCERRWRVRSTPCWRSPSSRPRQPSITCTSTGPGLPRSALVCRHGSCRPITRPREPGWSRSPAPTNGRTHVGSSRPGGDFRRNCVAVTVCPWSPKCPRVCGSGG